MIRLAAILMLLATLANGQTTHERYVLVQDAPGQSTSNVWVLAWSDRTNAPHWWHWANERGLTNAALTALPCLVDTESWQAVQRTGTLAKASADLRALARARRQAERDTVAAAREERAAWRAVAQEWRKAGRDTAQAVGLPAATGATWGVEAMYAAIGTVTNANTRRDLMLRALAADVAQTRYQLAQQYPSTAWWWVEDDTRE